MEGADWKSGGHTLGDQEFYAGGEGEEEVHDHGGWEGGEYVLGGGSGGGAASGSERSQTQGMSRREILAKAAEERIKRLREQSDSSRGNAGSNSG